MDVTSSTVAGSDQTYQLNTTYVSCVKVDGQPILPPLMTDKKREEMKRYRELAIAREKTLNAKRSIINQTVIISRKNEVLPSQETFVEDLSDISTTDPSRLKESRPSSPLPKSMPMTSTPRAPRLTYSVQVKGESTNDDIQQAHTNQNTDAVTANLKGAVLNDDCLHKSVYDSSPFANVVDIDDQNIDSPCNSEATSEDNFASAASSQGTFVIRRSTDNSIRHQGLQPEITDGYLSSSDDGRESSYQEPPQTVVRKSGGDDQVFKRKRPAKYFDVEDNVATDQSKYSSFSLPNRVPDQTDRSEACKSADAIGITPKFSPVPVTNFTRIAKSLTLEFTRKFCSTTPVIAEQQSDISDSGSYDVRLNKEIPSSAEKCQDDVHSDSSDKENVDSHHERKLSYTLATPSAALLEAVSKTDKLETLVSEAGSVGTGSNRPSPAKPSATKKIYFADDTSSIEQNNQATPGYFSKQTLSGVAGTDGKQAHLERFLGEMGKFTGTEVQEKLDGATDTLDLGDMQQMMKQMQEQHEAQLKLLAEEHRVQQLRIQKDFDLKMEKLKEQLSSTLNTTDSNKSCPKTSPSPVVDCLSTRTLTQTGDSTCLSESVSELQKSVALPVSLSGDTTSDMSRLNDTKSKDTSVFQFTGGSGRSTAKGGTSNVGHTDLAGVGLAKLHSKMHLMTPRMFKTPADGRSPLLKGIVFLDPLSKPAAPLRIPQKALEPSMKQKFDKVSAAVKGFLVRRLLNTEKVQIIVQTIRDTVDLLLKLYDEGASSGGASLSKPEDSALNQRLIQQLTGACRSFHDVFFKLSTKERMAIIATDRDKLRTKALRSLASPAKPNISNATLKSIERRLSHRASPIRRDNSKPRRAKAYDPLHGSQSVKGKTVKSFNISPKRRRMSYLEDVGPKSGSMTGRQDFNGNSYKLSSNRSQPTSSRSTPNVTRGNQPLQSLSVMSETFVVPSAANTPRNVGVSSTNSAGKPYTIPFVTSRDSSINKNLSARSSQSNTSVTSSSSIGVNRSRASISRQPWK